MHLCTGLKIQMLKTHLTDITMPMWAVCELKVKLTAKKDSFGKWVIFRTSLSFLNDSSCLFFYRILTTD